MTEKLTFGIVFMVAVVAMISGFPQRGRQQFTSQFPRLFQASCRVTNSTSGELLQKAVCQCGEETVACDVGPVSHFGVEMTFCNKLDRQTVDDLYIMQFACMSGKDANCGIGTDCDIGPFNYEGIEYFLCRFASSGVPVDTTEMCKPDSALTQPLMLGQAGPQRFFARGRQLFGVGGTTVWGQGIYQPYNPVINPPSTLPDNLPQTLPFNPPQLPVVNPPQTLPANPTGILGGMMMGGQLGQGRRAGRRF